MDQSAISTPLIRAQSSILSFFQPRSPSCAAPPSAANGASNGPATSAFESSSSLPAPTKSSSPAIVGTQASISPIYETHIQPLKRINSLLLPVNYPDSFYHRILDPSSSPNFSRVILWQDAPSKLTPLSTGEPKVVGGIVCRLDQDATSQSSSVYIQSLALLSPYRSYGLATAALEAVIESVVSAPQTSLPITSLYAHVWSENNDGLEWYAARGFTREESLVQGYYRILKPDSAWILRRVIGPGDYLRYKQPSITPTTDRSNYASGVVQNQPSIRPSPSLSAIWSPVPRASSYQARGPGHEWNDIPADILLKPSSSSSSLCPNPSLKAPSPDGSVASSRSSSAGGKKKRAYPPAAFAGGASSAT